MHNYGWTRDYVMDEITGAQGWVAYNWAAENAARMAGSSWVRTTDGYVKQEYKWRMKSQ